MGVATTEFRPNYDFKPFGPFIPKDFKDESIKVRTVIIGSIIFSLSCMFALSAAYLGIKQTRQIRRPWRSAYVWMIWIENLASTTIAVVCMTYLMKIFRPSFYFYATLLFLWSIQVQVILQIIINRIRVILPDRRKGKIIAISVAVLVSIIIVSVWCIWIPARLQISQHYIHVNNIWDRIEKCIYLVIDLVLNWYFIRVVKENLVRNGLQKYNKLVKWNEKLIVISILMDVMIIAAMSIPNGLLYASFHPLAYLVKLNIEMVMASLIRKIAKDSSHNADFQYEFGSDSGVMKQRNTLNGNSKKSADGKPSRRRSALRPWSLWVPKGNEIRKTEEYIVQSDKKSELELQGNIGAGQHFGYVSSANSTKGPTDFDAQSWMEGDEASATARHSRDTGESSGSGSKDTQSEHFDEESGLMKPELAYTVPPPADH